MIRLEAIVKRYGRPYRYRNISCAASLIWPAFLVVASLSQALARELLVGDGAPYSTPSAAAASVQAGDRVRILPGTYYDCAVWAADGIEILGSGETTRITDRMCQGKAIFVTTGNGIVIRDLTLARARTLEGNGSGIRHEGRDLVLRNVVIEDNQDGILALDPAGGTLRIESSLFRANGTAATTSPTGALRIGGLSRLIIIDTRFLNGRGEFVISSAARVTEIADSVIEAIPAGRGPTVQVEGSLVMDGNTIAPGSGPRGRRAAVLALDGEGGGDLRLHGNRLLGDGTLLLNWSSREARVSDNAIGRGSTEETRDGAWMNKARRLARLVYETLRRVVFDVMRALKALARSMLERAEA